MKQLRFKIGDRVEGKEGLPYIGGKVGTIVLFSTGGYDYGIEFDEPVENGHSVDGHGKDRHCRWVKDNELEPAPYFADARVGDSVYDMGYGPGIIDTDMGGSFIVCFKGSIRYTFNIEGVPHCLLPQRAYQTLFYSKPVFELPPPPKRKVKKVIEGWINFYKDKDYTSYNFSLTKKEADSKATIYRLGEAHFIRHEYEE